jgi:hypothetical protein
MKAPKRTTACARRKGTNICAGTKPVSARYGEKKGSHFQAVFRRLLGYKSVIWAIAHRLCRVIWKTLHEGVRYIEQGSESDPQVRERRARTLARALRKLGYDVAITPINPAMVRKAMQNLAGMIFDGALGR